MSLGILSAATESWRKPKQWPTNTLTNVGGRSSCILLVRHFLTYFLFPAGFSHFVSPLSGTDLPYVCFLSIPFIRTSLSPPFPPKSEFELQSIASCVTCRQMQSPTAALRSRSANERDCAAVSQETCPVRSCRFITVMRSRWGDGMTTPGSNWSNPFFSFLRRLSSSLRSYGFTLAHTVSPPSSRPPLSPHLMPPLPTKERPIATRRCPFLNQPSYDWTLKFAERLRWEGRCETEIRGLYARAAPFSASAQRHSSRAVSCSAPPMQRRHATHPLASTSLPYAHPTTSWIAVYSVQPGYRMVPCGSDASVEWALTHAAI